MPAIHLYTPNTIPTATTYQTIRTSPLLAAICQRRAEWMAVDPTLSTKITVSAMFEELADLLEELGINNAAEQIGLPRSH